MLRSRRDFLKIAGLSSVALSSAGMVNTRNILGSRSLKSKPNILLILTDQHRLSAIGAYGETVCKTPNLDMLAAKGVLFKNTYTASPLCTPARASLMTGQHIHAHRMGCNAGNFGSNVSQLPDTPDLLSRRLAQAGYSCGYTGKWHLGTGGSEGVVPSQRGFVGQDIPGHGNGGHKHHKFKKYIKENGYEHNIVPKERRSQRIGRYGIEKGALEANMPYYLASHKISLINKFNQEVKPFFIWHNNWGPHEPYYVPQEYYDMYKDVKIPQWPNYDWQPDNPHGPDRMKRVGRADQLKWEDCEEAIRHYYAFTTLIDHQIGRIMDHLEEKGIEDNTIIIFSSDHGESLGSHGGMFDKGFSHFEEVQRIGLIIKDPRLSQSQTGKKREELASLIDLYPTILDYAGGNYDAEKTHGRSLVPLIEGKTITWRDTVFVEFFGLGNMATNMITCRHGDIKYGYTCSNKDELYDLSIDPNEMNNLIDDPSSQETVLMMRKRIYTFMVREKYPGKGFFENTRLKEYTDNEDWSKLLLDIEL